MQFIFDYGALHHTLATHTCSPSVSTDHFGVSIVESDCPLDTSEAVVQHWHALICRQGHAARKDL